MTQPLSILIIDDEPDVGEVIASAAAEFGMSCVITTTAKDFVAALGPQTGLIFLDLMIPRLDGVELLRLLSAQSHKPDIALMSGIGRRVIESARRLAESLGLSVVAELQKPFRLAEVEAVLRVELGRSSSLKHPHESVLKVSDDEVLRAVRENEFVLHYQPQIRISDGRVIGVEALVRWQHPALGLVLPENFIPAVERLGLIDDLGWIVASLSLAELHRLRRNVECDLTMSINVSARSLRQLIFPDRLSFLLFRYKISPEKLVIEITESGLISELTSALDVLTRLRMKRVSLSIDDFGTGYSMMQQLRLVPANELKIDKSFVQNIQFGGSDLVMVLKTIEIAHDLDMQVIAEGVETEGQLLFLKEHGCDIAQGFFISKPLPCDRLAQWLSDRA